MTFQAWKIKFLNSMTCKNPVYLRQDGSQSHLFLILFLKGFPVVRGRVDLHRAPKWTDSTCQTVYFPPYRFYPDKQVHVQVTVNHVKLNDSMTVHDAVTSWTESVNTQNFTVCVLQAGRKSGEILNPFATVDWLAYQGAPPNGMTGTIKMQKWWSGTKCEHVAFPRVKSQNSLYPTRKGGQKAAP